MRTSILPAVAGALALALGALPAAAGGMQAATPGTAAPAAESRAGISPEPGGPPFPAGLVGHNLLNVRGDIVGTIRRVEGNRMVVGVGSYLGIGQHDIMLTHDEVNVSPDGTAWTPLSISTLQQKPALDAQSTIPAGGSGDRYEPR